MQTDDPPPTWKQEIFGLWKLLFWIVAALVAMALPGLIMFWMGWMPHPS